MSRVFQNIDPPPPHRPASVYPPAFGAGGGHCSVLYICKYFVQTSIDREVASEGRQMKQCQMKYIQYCSISYIQLVFGKLYSKITSALQQTSGKVFLQYVFKLA